MLEPQVAHHCRHDGALLQAALVDHALGAHRHDLVAVDDLPLLVHDDDPIGVPVEGDADGRPALHDLGAYVVRVERAGLLVDVHAVRLHADGRHLRPELLQDERRHAVGRPVRCVDHHAHAVERHVARERLLEEDDVSSARVLELLRAPDAGPSRAFAEELVVLHQLLDLALGLVGQLEPVRAEDLDAIVLIGVVARADDNPGVSAHAHGQVRHGRRGHRPAELHPAAHGAHAARDGLLEHVAREAGVLSDEDARHVTLSASGDEGDRPAELERQLRRHRVLVRDAADAVGAEKGACRRGRGAVGVGFLGHGKSVTHVDELKLDAEIVRADGADGRLQVVLVLARDANLALLDRGLNL